MISVGSQFPSAEVAAFVVSDLVGADVQASVAAAPTRDQQDTIAG
jgi:hypothetical protein